MGYKPEYFTSSLLFCQTQNDEPFGPLSNGDLVVLLTIPGVFASFPLRTVYRLRRRFPMARAWVPSDGARVRKFSRRS